jgi:aminoglycoside/choline kinase family phosphotransferase
MSPFSRPLEIAAFLDQNRWGEASVESFAADFSTRRYARLTQEDGQTAILMDADEDQKTPQFVVLAKALRKLGINVPEIYAAFAGRGLVLLQDFGVRNVGALLDAGENPKNFLLRAAEILAHLHQNFASANFPALDLPLMDTDYFVLQAELFLDEYIPCAKGREATDGERHDFRTAWRAVLRPIESMPQSLTLRDFIPDNLMALADGTLGVIDFQDAGVGPIAYDLASLCDEVRRDGAFALLPDVVAHYREQTASPISQNELMRACTILSAQRHTRTLGNVARTAVKRGQRERLAYLPRIEQHLRHILNETYLLPVREWMDRLEKS